MAQICCRCILSSEMSNVQIGEDGLCNFCRNSKPDSTPRMAIEILRQEILSHVRDEGADYDAVVALSGGKDSSVTLYIAREQLKLKPLAVTVDNGFLSQGALDNCRKVTDFLSVDWILVRNNVKEYKQIFRQSYIERESPCPTCSLLNMRTVCKIADEKGLGLVLTGHETLSTYNSNDDSFTGGITYPAAQAYFDGGTLRNNISVVRVLALFSIGEKQLMEILRILPWQPPDTIGGVSCEILGLSMAKAFERLNFHPYSFEFAEAVRTGKLTREEGLELIKKPMIPSDIETRLLERLNLT